MVKAAMAIFLHGNGHVRFGPLFMALLLVTGLSWSGSLSAQGTIETLLTPDRANLKPGVPRGLLLPSWYPSFFERAGVFRKYDDTKNEVYIDASRYPVSMGFQVSSPLIRSAGHQYLKSGMSVGMSVGRDEEGGVVVHRLWVLPDGVMKGDGGRYGLVVK